MARVPLLGGAYQMRSLIAGAQRSVNLFSENNPGEAQSPVPVTTYPTPGLRFLGRPSDQPGTPDPVPAPPAPPFDVGAVHFDGATTVSNAALTAADSGDLSWSFWARLAGLPLDVQYFSAVLGDGDTGDQYFSTGNPAVFWNYGTGWFDGVSGTISAKTSNFTSAIPQDTWVNVKVSLRTNFALGAKTLQIYIGDVDVTSDLVDSAIAFLIPFNGQPLYIGGDAAQFAPPLMFTGDMAEYWFAPGQFIDWSIEANRRKFISATGKPVDLGSDGSTPTGTAPAAYLHATAADPAGSFPTNLGTGGAFAVTAGGLTNASTSPSD